MNISMILWLLISISMVRAAMEDEVRGSNWAVLIAGSNGYYNYRHQSDISHSYQILRKLGLYPPSHIITMMYDDVAWSDYNPFPGQLFNEPEGDDIYSGIHIDYVGDDVTAENFLSVLRGDPIINRPELPVLNNTSSMDNIFIYYSDHGAPGLVAMPIGLPLYADDLHKTFHYMHENDMYNELVFYLEACESGSMFDRLLDDTLSIFATTASTPTESSYAYYYNDTLSTYMADEYSIRWMQDSQTNWLRDESLINQFNNVATIVEESSPQRYGDESFADATIHEFQDFEFEYKQNKVKQSGYIRKEKKVRKEGYVECDTVTPKVFDPFWVPSKTCVDCRDVKLVTLQHRYLQSNNNFKQQKHWKRMIEIELMERKKISVIFEDILNYLTGSYDDGNINMNFQVYDMDIAQWDCLKTAYNEFENICGTFNDFSLKYVKYLVHLCHLVNRQEIIEAFKQVCN